MTTDREDLSQFVRDELPALVRLFTSSRAQELEISDEGIRLRLKRATEASGALGSGAMAADLEDIETSAISATRLITAPMVGTYFHAEQPGRAPLIEQGSRVESGTLIGVIEALGVLTEVESDAHGVVHNIMIEDGQPVQYGEPLVEVLLDV